MPGLLDPRLATGTRVDDETTRRYLESREWARSPLGAVLRQAAAEHPERTAVVTRAGARTSMRYRELAQTVDDVRAGLRRLGVGPGDVVSVMLPNTQEFAVLIWAVAELGAVYSGIPPTYGAREAGFMLRRAEAKVLVVPERHRDRDLVALAGELRADVEQLHTVVVLGAAPQEPGWCSFADLSAPADPDVTGPPEEVDPASLVHLGFTSGTTGEPKAVMNTHQTLQAVLERWVGHVGADSLGTPVVNLVCSPVAHHTGFLWGVLLSAYLGGTAVFSDRWDANVAARTIDDEGVTVMVAAPTFLQDLSRCDQVGPEGLRSLTFACIPGAPIPRPLVRAAAERLDTFVCPAWGMTEYGIGISGTPDSPADRLAATDGVAVPGCDVRVVDPVSRVPLVAGEAGSLEIGGAGLFLGYLDRPDATAEAIKDGWFSTGDLATMDEDGFVTLQGRTKDVIIRGGENISPVAVENLLHDHPSVLDAAVVGYPDPRLGERACAVLVVGEGNAPTLDDVATFLLEQGLSKHFLPERLELVDALPKTMSGKVRKVELRDWLAG